MADFPFLWFKNDLGGATIPKEAAHRQSGRLPTKHHYTSFFFASSRIIFAPPPGYGQASPIKNIITPRPLTLSLDRFEIACVRQFGKLSHDHGPIAAICPYTRLQTD